VIALIGFAVYSGGLVFFVEAHGWPRLLAALVAFGGLMAAGWARWGIADAGGVSTSA